MLLSPMYMGFLDKLRKNRKETIIEKEPEHLVEVKINDVVDWLNRETANDIERSKKELSKKWGLLVSRKDEILSALKKLGKDSFEPNDKTYAVVNMTKDSFVSNSTVQLNKIARMPDSNYSSAKRFHSTLSDILNKISVNQKQSYIMSNYFKGSFGGVIKSIKLLDEQLSGYNKTIEEGKALKVLEEVGNLASEHNKIGEEKSYLDDSQREFSEQVKKAEQELSGARNELNRLRESEDWGRISSLDKRKGEIEKEISDINFLISEELSIIKRPLKKLAHDDKRFSLSRSQVSDIENSIKSPLKEFLGNHDGFKQTINTLKTNIRDLNLKDTELDKLGKLFSGLENGEILNLRRKTFELEKAKSKIMLDRSSLEKLVDEESKLSRGIVDMDTTIKKTEKELSEVQRKRKETESSISKIKSDIEKTIFENLNRKVKII